MKTRQTEPVRPHRASPVGRRVASRVRPAALIGFGKAAFTQGGFGSHVLLSELLKEHEVVGRHHRRMSALRFGPSVARK